MDFSFNEDQRGLRDYAQEFLDAEFSTQRVAELANSPEGCDPATAKQLAELGWFDPDITFLDRALLYEAAGRALLPSPWFSTVTLVQPLLDKSDATAIAISSGEATATLAWAESGRRSSLLDSDSWTTSVSADGMLTGTKVLVPDLTWVDRVAVLVADAANAPALYEVDLRSHPDVVRPQQNLDSTRRFSTLELRDTPARRLDVAAPIDLRELRCRLFAAAACEAIGVANYALDVAVQQGTEREQFGKPIGSYQAISHRLADVFTAIELARSLAYRAAWSVDSGITGDQWEEELCIAAKEQASAAAVFASERAIQTLGGMGMTWDHPLHRWFKRALGLKAWEGDSTSHFESIATAVLADAASRTK